MKQFLVLFMIFFGIGSTYGKCSYGGISVFPENYLINQNSIFMIEGYGTSQTIIKGFNSEYPVYLKSGDKIVHLIVIDTYTSQHKLTQSILKPETELEAGLEYTLYIDNLREIDNLRGYSNKNLTNGIAVYEVLEERDNRKPIVLSKPKEVSKTSFTTVDGLITNVTFSCTVQDESRILVKTTVKNLKTRKDTTYCIILRGNTIEVGHNKCYGAFRFDDGDDYEVAFTFMDSSGNITLWKGPGIRFARAKGSLG